MTNIYWLTFSYFYANRQLRPVKVTLLSIDICRCSFGEGRVSNSPFKEPVTRRNLNPGILHPKLKASSEVPRPATAILSGKPTAFLFISGSGKTVSPVRKSD